MPRGLGGVERGAPPSTSASWTRRYTPERTSLAAAALGAITVAGFAPFYLYPVPVLTLALLLWLCGRSPSPKRAGALGWWFGLGFFLTGVSWVYVSLHDFGAMPAPLAAFATLIFCAYLALFPALTGYAYRALGGSAGWKLALWVPAVWTAAEWTRGWLFTGFPWIAAGYSQIPSSPLAGYAPVLGVYGVTFTVLASAGLLVALAGHLSARASAHAENPQRARLRLQGLVAHPALIVLVVIWAGGYGLKSVTWTDPIGAPTTVALLQGNIAQDIKWTEEGLRTTFATYRSLALASKAKLTIFPETALPIFLRDVPGDYLGALADHARHNGGDVLIGVPERLPDESYYNSVISIGTAPIQAYRKTHLVPFGEFIPLRPVLGWIVSVLAIPLQDFSRGNPDAKPLAVAGQRVAMNICYEDAFGEEIIRQLPAATLLANVSNVAWFGRSIAPQQHLQISQARALETGRYMLRATNTGMTAIVNERGVVVQAAPQFATATVTGSVQGFSGSTPYVRWGNAPIIGACLLLIVAALTWSRMRR